MLPDSPVPPDSPVLLVVCTGNVCRSPIAAGLLQAGLAQRLGPAAGGFRVRSAGTQGWVGRPMEPFAAQALRELGVEQGRHVGQQLTADLVSTADLVLCASREHRAAAVTLHPRAAGRTFTIRELDRLLAGATSGGVTSADPRAAGTLAAAVRALAAVAGSRRGLVASAPGEDDLPDPLGRPLAAFQDCAWAVQAALAHPLDLLAAAVGPAD